MGNETILLNRPRNRKRGLTIETSGRITLRSEPCRLLDLKAGSKVVFVYTDSQLYIMRSEDFDYAISLYGRDGQLHGCSASTIKNIIKNYIRGVPEGAKKIDLVVARMTEKVNIYGSEHEALAVISRTDKEHCR